MKTFCLIFIILFTAFYNSAQDSITGYYTSNFAIVGWFGTQINLKQDSTFDYLFAGDLFYDKASGRYEQDKNEIILHYQPIVDSLDLSFTDSLGEVKRIKFLKPENSAANSRPAKLVYRNNKLLLYDRNNKRIYREMNAAGRKKRYYLIKRARHIQLDG